jgi:lysophospholipase L1-like esterase
MKMKRTLVLGAVALSTLVATSGTGVAQSTTATSGPSFAALYAIGDSLAAGFSNGALVDAHQKNSVPALIAQQAGQSIQLPLISEPGIPAELTLVSLSGPTGLVILPKATSIGAPENLAFAGTYNDVAVPGSSAIDAFQTVADSNPFTGIILRGFGSQLAQVANAHPSFVIVWVGNNDVLGAVVNGEAIEGVTLTPPGIFAQVYSQIITTLVGTGATVVAANLPDVTTIPYVTAIPPFVSNPATGLPVMVNGQPVGLIGPNGPLNSSDFVTLAAAPFLARGTGIPAALGGNGQPLPDNVILDPNKVATIQAHVQENNQAIAQICTGAKVPLVDINGILKQFATSGRDVGGIRLTAAFLSGGVFGYDGIHPTDLGYAIVANEWINVINANGGTLPPVSLAPYLGVGSASVGRDRTIPFRFTSEDQARLEQLFPKRRRP